MGNGMSPLYESAIVAVEVFTIWMYLSGVFLRNDRSRLHGVLAYLIFGLVLAVASTLLPDMLLLSAITFIGVSVLACFLYNSHILSAVFASLLYLMLAVAVESLVLTLYSWLFTAELESLRSFGVERVFATIIVKLIILLLIKIVSIIMKKHKDSLHRRMLQSIPLIFCQLILIYIIADRFISSYVESGILTQKSVLEIACLFLVDIVVLWYYDLLVSIYELRYKNEIATMQLENQVKHYGLIRTHQDTINAIEHDMKKHIKAIAGMAIAGYDKDASDYLSSFADTLNENMGLVFTPHPMVSSILSYCRQRANRVGVELHLDVSVPSSIEINQIDLTVIMGNTIDNALEALERIGSGRKMLHISLKQSDYYLFYEITNSYDLAARKKRLDNKRLHGYGLKNVRACVDKYRGSFNINDKAAEYTVTIMIPCQVKTQE